MFGLKLLFLLYPCGSTTVSSGFTIYTFIAIIVINNRVMVRFPCCGPLKIERKNNWQ